MAGAFTHMAIIAKTIEILPDNWLVKKIARGNFEFLTLGGVSPDIPYLAYLEGKGFNWADIMHYHQTNGIFHNGLFSLKSSKKREGDWNCKLAWLLGFSGHLVADATIHPIVNCIAGPYIESDSHNRHTLCEVTQDIMIFKDEMNLDLAESEYTNLLKNIDENDYYDSVCDFWSALAKVNFPINEDFDAKGMIDSYLKLLGIGEGSSQLAKGFRHLGIKFIYPTLAEMEKDSEYSVSEFYERVKLPNGQEGSFKENGFNYAV